jgi:hypothetical protein
VADFAGSKARLLGGGGESEAGETGGDDVEGGEGGVGWVLGEVRGGVGCRMEKGGLTVRPEMMLATSMKLPGHPWMKRRGTASERLERWWTKWRGMGSVKLEGLAVWTVVVKWLNLWGLENGSRSR